MSTFKTITSVEEARALCKARLLWWNEVEPADLWWSTGDIYTVKVLEEYVAEGCFSILLED